MTDENFQISLEKDEKQSLELFNSDKYSTTCKKLPFSRALNRSFANIL